MKFIGWLLKHVAGVDAYAIARTNNKTDRIKLKIDGDSVALVAIMVSVARSLTSDSGKTMDDLIEILGNAEKYFDE